MHLTISYFTWHFKNNDCFQIRGKKRKKEKKKERKKLHDSRNFSGQILTVFVKNNVNDHYYFSFNKNASQ